MIELKTSCIGVRCPSCGKNIVEYINTFQFSSGVTLFCPDCGMSVLTIKKHNAGNLSLRCFACGNFHSYQLSRKAFLSEKLSCFGCKENNIDVLFTGTHDDVDIALMQLSKEMDILTEKYYDNLEQTYGIYPAAALRILEEKAKQKRVLCLCGSHNLNIKLADGGIYVICTKCGSSEFILVQNTSDIEALKKRPSIVIMNLE